MNNEQRLSHLIFQGFRIQRLKAEEKPRNYSSARSWALSENWSSWNAARGPECHSINQRWHSMFQFTSTRHHEPRRWRRNNHDRGNNGRKPGEDSAKRKGQEDSGEVSAVTQTWWRCALARVREFISLGEWFRVTQESLHRWIMMWVASTAARGY